jgi:hypothetical protein
MKTKFIPYYVSRVALSLAMAFLVFGLAWKALVLAAFFMGFFVLYLHSGWFQIDPARPFWPLQRDDRGREIQRKALIASAASGVGLFVILAADPFGVFGQLAAGPLAMVLGVCVYFAVQFFLFARS